MIYAERGGCCVDCSAPSVRIAVFPDGERAPFKLVASFRRRGAVCCHRLAPSAQRLRRRRRRRHRRRRRRRCGRRRWRRRLIIVIAKREKMMSYYLPQGMTPSVSNTYYASLEAPRLTTEVPEDNDVLPETVTDSTKPEDVRKPRRKGTNLYGRPYCPGRPLSMAERRRIIELHMSGMKVNAISKTLCISHGCVSKIISRYRQTGILSPASSPEQRRTRRKKNESPPAESQEYKPEFKHDYSHPEYVTHDFRVHYAAQPHPAEMAMPHYTMIPEQMLVPDYSQPVLL
ncbi:hypothetical protein Y032_0325g2552 [Ancylostoma ceylanicum]|uniref:Paired domain-containing protein n=1 Tax=Ancylostoma ceylanicum TaxID=53326 RepID=A0A016S023_9BILA|nr:hypothetical protein Y032_0325g2552 [Ancylostoma ceylanicum]